MTLFAAVDDEPDILALVRANVQAWGDECLTAASIDELELILDEHSVDVLIVDIAMPFTDGVAVVNRLRETNRAPAEIFLMSALPPDELEQLAANLGTGWISKPFTADGLRQAVAHE